MGKQRDGAGLFWQNWDILGVLSRAVPSARRTKLLLMHITDRILNKNIALLPDEEREKHPGNAWEMVEKCWKNAVHYGTD
jgi:hypothetical protein